MIKKLLQKNNSVFTFTLIMVSLLSQAACKKEAPPAAPAQQAKAPVVKPKPVQKPVSSSTALRLPPPAVNQFDFSNKKDPFKAFVAVKAEPKSPAESKKSVKKDSLPLHSFDVSQFKLIGIITGGRENQAMVTDPGGKGYVLKAGMIIGKNDGKVISISSHGVDILEQFKDENGRIRKENIKLTLPTKQ